MLSHLDPASSLAIGLLIFSFILVIAFETSNGFHDTANAVATVIYTKSLPPVGESQPVKVDGPRSEGGGVNKRDRESK